MPPCNFSSAALPCVMPRNRGSRISISPAMQTSPEILVVEKDVRPAAVAPARAGAGLLLVPIGELDDELAEQDHGDDGEDDGDIVVHAQGSRAVRCPAASPI